MSDHLTSLQLDEIAAGLGTEPAHLGACPRCSKRLAELRAEHGAFLSRPEAKRQMEALAPAPNRRSFIRFLGVAAPLAAGLAILLAWPRPPPEDRLKGAPALFLLDQAGRPVNQAAAGERLTLAVGSGGFPRVTVYAVAADGKQETLWSGPIQAGARVPLAQLEVTPGDVTLTAEFENGTQKVSATVRLSVP